MQAKNTVQKTTAKDDGSNFSLGVENMSYDSRIQTEQVQFHSRRKTQERNSPAQNHISDNLSVGESSDLKRSSDYHFVHPQRQSNLKNDSFKQSIKSKLNLPKSSDKVWTKINAELSIILPKIFSKSVIKNTSTGVLCDKFDKWLYVFFLDKFGVEERPSTNHDSNSKKGNFERRSLKLIRKQKKQCTAAYKALKEKGLENLQKDLR